MKVALIAGVLLSAALVTGCTTTADRFKRYGGQDIRQVMVEFGEPDAAFDMPEGLRAFQWILHSTYTTPTHISTQRFLRDKKDPDSWASSNVTIHGGDVVETSCLYTLLARWEEARKGWIVSPLHEARVSCQ